MRSECTRGYHKIKHLACHRDFFLDEISRITHTQNASYPGIKHFKWLILFSTNDWLWNVLYPGMKHFAYVLYVEFHAKRNLCDKQNVLFYVTPRIWHWFSVPIYNFISSARYKAFAPNIFYELRYSRLNRHLSFSKITCRMWLILMGYMLLLLDIKPVIMAVNSTQEFWHSDLHLLITFS